MSVSAHASLASKRTLLTFTYPHPHSKDGKGKNDLVLSILGDNCYIRRTKMLLFCVKGNEGSRVEYLELEVGIRMDGC